MKPYEVEIRLPASRDEVWSALTQPALLRQWFGWDYADLDAEITQIFVDAAAVRAPHQMAWADGSWLEVTGDDSQAHLRVQRDSTGSGGTERYDAIEEGWRAFLTQLRFLLERRPTGRRRTIYLTGETTGRAALELAGGTWERFGERVAWTVGVDGHLVVVSTRLPLDDADSERAEVTISTYGLDDATFDSVRDDWTRRWIAIAAQAHVTTAADPSPTA